MRVKTKKTTTPKTKTVRTKQIAARYGITNREAIRIARQSSPGYKACRAFVALCGTTIIVEFYSGRKLARTVDVTNAYATGLVG